MVTWTIPAVYQNGAFRPLTPVVLPENTCVTLLVQGEQQGEGVVPPFGQMDETDWAWSAWAGSLGVVADLDALERDEG